MGRITVFTKDGCRFCDIVLALLRRAVQCTIAECESSNCDYIGLELLIVNVTADIPRANQCKALSGQHTVPQVFFQDAYIGNCMQTELFQRSGELRTRLLALARTPSCDFPPPPDANIVKISARVAASAQPSHPQLCGLRAKGFRTVICLVHELEPGYAATTESTLAAQGVVYAHAPPAAPPVIPIGIVASSVPSNWLAMASPGMRAVAGVREVLPAITLDAPLLHAGCSSATTAPRGRSTHRAGHSTHGARSISAGSSESGARTGGSALAACARPPRHPSSHAHGATYSHGQHGGSGAHHEHRHLVSALDLVAIENDFVSPQPQACLLSGSHAACGTTTSSETNRGQGSTPSPASICDTCGGGLPTTSTVNVEGTSAVSGVSLATSAHSDGVHTACTPLTSSPAVQLETLFRRGFSTSYDATRAASGMADGIHAPRDDSFASGAATPSISSCSGQSLQETPQADGGSSTMDVEDNASEHSGVHQSHGAADADSCESSSSCGSCCRRDSRSSEDSEGSEDSEDSSVSCSSNSVCSDADDMGSEVDALNTSSGPLPDCLASFDNACALRQLCAQQRMRTRANVEVADTAASTRSCSAPDGVAGAAGPPFMPPPMLKASNTPSALCCPSTTACGRPCSPVLEANDEDACESLTPLPRRNTSSDESPRAPPDMLGNGLLLALESPTSACSAANSSASASSHQTRAAETLALHGSLSSRSSQMSLQVAEDVCAEAAPSLAPMTRVSVAAALLDENISALCIGRSTATPLALRTVSPTRAHRHVEMASSSPAVGSDAVASSLPPPATTATTHTLSAVVGAESKSLQMEAHGHALAPSPHPTDTHTAVAAAGAPTSSGARSSNTATLQVIAPVSMPPANLLSALRRMPMSLDLSGASAMSSSGAASSTASGNVVASAARVGGAQQPAAGGGSTSAPQSLGLHGQYHGAHHRVRRSSVSSEGTATAASVTSEDSSRWSDVDDETLRSFDMHDDDISGRDPFVMVYTVPWARAVLQAIHDAAPPVLIFCRSGAAAFVLALLDSAQTRKATARQVHKWASQLGIDLEAHVDLLHIVSVLCHEWSADAHTYR